MNEKELESLLYDWTETYKKSLLSFWTLLSIYDSEKYVAEIMEYLLSIGDGSLQVQEQSLYRALRRFKSMGLVEITEHPSPSGGPNRKYFSLSDTGRVLLSRFIEQNISPMYDKNIMVLITSAKKGII